MSGNTPSSVQCAFCESAIDHSVTAANANAEPVHESCLVSSMVDEIGRTEADVPPERETTLAFRSSK